MPDTSKPPSADDLLALLDDFPWDDWQKKLAPGLTQVTRDLIKKQGSATTRKHGSGGVTFSMDDPLVSAHVQQYVGARITQLSDTSKADVSRAIVRAFDNAGDDLSTSDLRDLVLDIVRDKYDGYESWRALNIARTESAIGYNTATILGGDQAGFEYFDVTDGEDDEECADANGDVWSRDEALGDPLAHPNCTRVFTPTADAPSNEAE